MKAIRRVFRWAESEELVPPGHTNALETADPLPEGRTVARELPPVEPVPDDVVEATLPHLSPIVADMVRLQGFTGARPGEICMIRPMDVERTGDVWMWRPPHHKTRWRGKERIIVIGKQGQGVLARYLLRDEATSCFSPAESENLRSQDRRLARKSPLTPSQRARKAKPKGQRRPRPHYDNASYRRVVSRAVATLNAERRREDPAAPLVKDWAPNQLRHALATKVRERFGVEEAQVVLGHSNADITQVYAKRNEKLAVQVMGEIG